MPLTKNNILFSYEENERLSAEIEKVMKEDISDFQKIKKLRVIGSSARAPISKSHVDYCLKKLTDSRRNRIKGIISLAVSFAYFIFILFRIYWYFNPDKNPFSSAAKISINDLVVFMYLIPVLIIGILIVKRILRKNNDRSSGNTGHGSHL